MYHIYAKKVIEDKLHQQYRDRYELDYSTACITSITNNYERYNIQIKGCDDEYSPPQCTYLSFTIQYQEGLGQFITYQNITNNGASPTSCIIGSNSLDITDNPFYYSKIDGVMIIFFVICIVCFWFPFKIFSRAFGRWFKI